MLLELRMGLVQLDVELACWARETAQSPVREHNGSRAPRKTQRVVAGTVMHHAGSGLRQEWAECWQVVAAVRMQ